MTEIDFLPADYRSRRASRRDQWYVIALGAVLLVVLLGSMLHQSHLARTLRAQLASLQDSRSDLQAKRTEVQRLETRRAELASDAKFFCLLGAHPAVSRVLVAVSASCPARLALNTIVLKPDRQAIAESKAVRGAARASTAPSTEPPEVLRAEQIKRFGELRAQTGLTLEIEGMAESDLVVAQFMERLEDSDCFARVELGTAVEQQASASSVRDFKIQCRVEKLF